MDSQGGKATAIKVRLPKIVALETGPNAEYNRAEFDCGCVTVRISHVPSIWTYLERCPTHAGDKLPRSIVIEPRMPDWWGR